ncbi:MAG TPA: beta-ketoacyl synthase N-terminal-like domain-containing protein [Herpetosiphonaceae bacterium]
MTDYHSETTGNEIAVIGLACRFPGANDVDAFWHNLQHGIETISFFDDDELEPSVIDHTTDPTHPHFVRAAAAIEGVDLFDAQFFGYAPKDAALIDPQQRLFLEYAWMALEAAGYDPERYPDAIGVFAGARTNTYIYNLLFNRPAVGNLTPFEIGVSNDFSCLSTRVAYKLNLRGPAYSLHTACSTGLSAIHLACQSVLIGECRMALAGGVAINVPQHTGYLYREGGIASPDGHCRAFDAGAQGTILGSGIGVVVLKRLEDALADGDTIHAVIKGSAANNDGSAKASYTAPSVDGQAAVIEEALTVAGVEPSSIGYVEAHGTGTHLGDPIEIRALTKAFRSADTRSGSCAIGSVKTNFGHLESAAGLAGFIKTVLALKHKQIPASLHFTRANPDLHLDQTPFYVNSALSEWPASETPRRAGVSAFGVGGTNIHIILEEAPPLAAETQSDRPWHVLPISAKTPTALDQATTQLADFLEAQPELPLADAAYTLQIGRGEFDYRRIAVCRDRAHAVAVLRGDEPQHLMSDVYRVGDRPLVWMFAGQGSQFVNMAADLYTHVALFREQVDRCAEHLRRFVDFDIRRLLTASDGTADWINQTEVAQPALFVVEYALAQTLLAWGLKPTSMIGHSIGEYVAATLAGVFSLEDALRLVALRGQLMQALPGGAMLTVALPEADLRSRLHPEDTRDLDLAAVNAPDSVVVSGAHSAIDRFARQLEEQGVSVRRLQTSHAFHSHMMEPMLAAFERAVAEATLSPPQIPFVSNLTGTWIRNEEATSPRYWSQHLRQTVRFADGLALLLQQPNAVLLDVGPGRTLSRLAQRHPSRASQHTLIATLSHPKDQASDLAVLLTALGKLWLAGVRIDWQRFHGDEQRLRVALPTYPFERQRYWIDPLPDQLNSTPAPAKATTQPRNPIDAWFYTPSWRRVERPPVAEWTQERKTWLLLAPESDGFGDQLITALEHAGQTVIVVAPGERYHELGANRYTVNPRAREDYLTLAGALMAGGQLPDVALHLWSLAHQPADTVTVESFDAAQPQGFYSLLFFAQAFFELVAALKLVVVTQQLYDVRGDEELRPELATLLGPCSVIPQEYPHIDCRVIDLGVAARDQDRLSAQLLDEIGASTQERVVALRGRHRWVQDLAPVQREAQPTPAIRQQGVYFITGGLAAAGYLFAEHLARTADARLVLLESEPLPPRETWDQWVNSYGPQNEVSVRITNARALEATGVELLVLSADFSDPAAVQATVEQARTRFGAIHGVIHAANVMDSGLIPLRSFDAIEHQFTARARGCINLHAALRAANLDFFVLCSSINAILGELGQVDQCAANSFLDLYAQTIAAAGARPVTVIHWDAWQANSAMVQTMLQMAAIPPAATERLQQEVDNGLRNDEGIAAFLRIVTGKPLPQIVVSVQDLETRRANLALLTEDLRRARESLTFVKQQYGRPDLQTAYVAPSTDDERLVAGIWQEVLGIEQIGIHDDFFELGGHSLLVTLIAGRLRDVLGVEIPIEKLFEKPTIAGILEIKAELQTSEDSAAAEILSLLAQLSDEEAELELRRRLSSFDDQGGEASW